MLPSVVTENSSNDSYDNAPHRKTSQSAFVSACSLGLVKLWQFVASEKYLEPEIEGHIGDNMALLITVQATIKVTPHF